MKTRFKITNDNYVWSADGLRLVRYTHPARKPWSVYGLTKVRHFRTHAKAVKWAARKVREGRK